MPRPELAWTWIRISIAALTALTLVGCPAPDPSGPATTTTIDPKTPTFHKDVEPLLQRSCQSCHMPGGIAPEPFLTYAETRDLATLIALKTKDRSMPPWDAVGTPDCSPRHAFRNDLRLSDDEIALLDAWRAAGAPEGDPADAPPPKDLKPPALTDASIELAPKTPYVTSGDKDEFRCFVLDPKLAERKYIDGTFVVPDNRKVVHHAVVVADPKRESLKMVGPDGSYDCFGGVGFDDAQVLAVWTPGQDPVELPSNIGTPIDAGSLVVMQIHYHPAGTIADPDSTRVDLRYAPKKPDYFLLPATPIGNYGKLEANGDGLQRQADDPKSGPEFRIPANAKAHVEEMVLTIPAPADGSALPDVWVYGVAAHMHLIGVDETVVLEHKTPSNAEPARECLLHEPRWSFDWQRIYSYDAPVADLPLVKVGDKIRVRCTYDNTLDNPGTVRSVHDNKTPGPVDVRLGEETTDEMCLALIPLLYKAP